MVSGDTNDTEITSSTLNITCKNIGVKSPYAPEHPNSTKDYVACKSLVTLVDNFSYGNQATDIMQNVDRANNNAKIESTLWEQTQRAQHGTSHLEAMKGNVDKQYQHKIQKAAISAAELVTLQTKISSFPTAKDGRALCQGSSGEERSVADKIISSFTSYGTQIFSRVNLPNPIDNYSPCRLALAKYGPLFFPNGGAALIALKEKKFQAGMRAATEALQASLSKKLSDDIKDRIKALKKRKEDAIAEGGFKPELLVNPCLANPLLPACKKESPGGFTPGSFNFEGTGNTASLTSSGPDFSDASPDKELNIGADAPILNNATKELEKKLSKSLGGQRPSGSRPGFGTGSGSGGAGSGSGGSGSGGSGGVSGKDFKKGGRRPVPPGKLTANFRGGARRLFSRGSAKLNKNNQYNSGALKKKAQDKIREGILNYRLPASVTKRNTNIFQRISLRYNKVAKDNRLLEYQVK